jgi:Nucleotidyl transferase of unknown function (DUF2204)
MPHTADHPEPGQLADPEDAAAAAVYGRVLDVLESAGVPFLVGGSHALARHTGVDRRTKDLDLFILPEHLERATLAAVQAGMEAEVTHPHWLGKVRAGEVVVDLIFNSGNGLSPVDSSWFDHAPRARVLERELRLIPVEELLWSKLFIMERERYDGADVAHLLLGCAATLDWRRLLTRVGPHWRVLLAHLVMFGYVYPSERACIPASLLDALLQRVQHELHGAAAGEKLCRGTLLSRAQYLHDVQHGGFLDARLTPVSTMDARDVVAWTQAITPVP